MRRRVPTGTALAATLAACTIASAPGPVITSVAPDRVSSGVDTVVVIRGSGFVPRVRVDLDQPSSSEVDAGFRIEIARGAAPVALSAVTLRSETEISAILPAGAAAHGTYDVVLVDPRGRTASLPAGLTVVECVPDDAPCEDGDACTVGDVCVSGSCVAGGAVVCPPPGACQVVGTCDSGTGQCSNAYAVADGTECNDGDPCTTDDACHAGHCAGTLVCSTESNTPPLACLVVSPVAGIAGTDGATRFTFDASCSSDAEDDALHVPLTFRFAPEVGAGWTAPSTSPVASASYPAPGVHGVAVEVVDSGLPQGTQSALRAYAYRSVVTAADTSLVLVTTSLDEDDPGATPSSPGGDGLSLREAIEHVNGGGVADRVIAFAPVVFGGPTTIRLQSRLPELAVEGTAIAGLPGVVVDCAGAILPAGWGCIRLGGARQMVVGLTVVGCADAAVAVASGCAGCRVLDCTLVGPGTTVASPTSSGVEVKSPIAIGPRNDVSGFYRGVTVKASGAIVDGNRIHGNIVGVSAHDTDAIVQRNEIYGNAGAGVDLTRGPMMDTVWLNTIDGNSGDGIHANGATLDVRDNLLTWNGGFGLNASGCSFATPGALGPNGYFENGRGPVSGSATLVPGDVAADPLYVSRPAADYRLLPASTARDAGIDVGLDVNGPSGGNFDGPAPDLGANEYLLP